MESAESLSGVPHICKDVHLHCCHAALKVLIGMFSLNDRVGRTNWNVYELFQGAHSACIQKLLVFGFHNIHMTWAREESFDKGPRFRHCARPEDGVHFDQVLFFTNVQNRMNIFHSGNGEFSHGLVQHFDDFEASNRTFLGRLEKNRYENTAIYHAHSDVCSIQTMKQRAALFIMYVHDELIKSGMGSVSEAIDWYDNSEKSRRLMMDRIFYPVPSSYTDVVCLVLYSSTGRNWNEGMITFNMEKNFIYHGVNHYVAGLNRRYGCNWYKTEPGQCPAINTYGEVSNTNFFMKYNWTRNIDELMYNNSDKKKPREIVVKHNEAVIKILSIFMADFADSEIRSKIKENRDTLTRILKWNLCRTEVGGDLYRNDGLCQRRGPAIDMNYQSLSKSFYSFGLRLPPLFDREMKKILRLQTPFSSISRIREAPAPENRVRQRRLSLNHGFVEYLLQREIEMSNPEEDDGTVPSFWELAERREIARANAKLGAKSK